jgi:hypothetical protein
VSVERTYLGHRPTDANDAKPTSAAVTIIIADATGPSMPSATGALEFKLKPEHLMDYVEDATTAVASLTAWRWNHGHAKVMWAS